MHQELENYSIAFNNRMKAAKDLKVAQDVERKARVEFLLAKEALRNIEHDMLNDLDK